jgi:hypothetical protein
VNEDWAETKISELLSEALFSRDGFRFSIGITPLRAEEFFANQGNEEILRQRQRLLLERPHLYAQTLERGVDRHTLVTSVRQWEPAVSGADIQTLAPKISQFISRLDSKRCFQRTNWGLTGSRSLDQHPHRRIPPIGAATDPATVDLRIEWQALIGLPDDLVLFGIRVFHVPLSRVRATPKLAELLAENLVSMPSAVAEYKRLADCRRHLISYLRE